MLDKGGGVYFCTVSCHTCTQGGSSCTATEMEVDTVVQQKEHQGCPKTPRLNMKYTTCMAERQRLYGTVSPASGWCRTQDIARGRGGGDNTLWTMCYPTETEAVHTPWGGTGEERSRGLDDPQSWDGITGHGGLIPPNVLVRLFLGNTSP